MTKEEFESNEGQWEQDCHYICDALGVESDVENADTCADIATQHIAMLKHIANEVAVCGDCDCDMIEFPHEKCVYCIAVEMTRKLGIWREEDEIGYHDFMYEQFGILPKKDGSLS